MGKKTRKTRWRTLAITSGEQSDSEESNNSQTGHQAAPKSHHNHHHPPKAFYSKFPYSSSQSTPVRNRFQNDAKSTRSSSTTSENKITFNEDEYTKITTPRQDVLFKKGYLSKPKTYQTQTSTGNSTVSTGNSTGNGTPDHQSADGTEGTDLEYESQFVFPNGYVDPNGIYYINSFEPYPPLVVYNAPYCYPEYPITRSKRYSTDSLTESTSPNNEETSQDQSQSGGETTFCAPEDSAKILHHSEDDEVETQPDCENAEQRKVKKRRRRKLSKPIPDDGTTSEDSEEQTTLTRIPVEVKTTELNAKKTTELKQDAKENARKTELKQDAKEVRKSELKVEAKEVRKTELKPDAKEFVPRAYQNAHYVPNFIPLPLISEIHPAFLHPVNFMHNYVNFIPNYVPSSNSVNNGGKLHEIAEEEKVVDVKEEVANFKNNIDIEKIVSKLEEAAKEQRFYEKQRKYSPHHHKNKGHANATRPNYAEVALLKKKKPAVTPPAAEPKVPARSLNEWISVSRKKRKNRTAEDHGIDEAEEEEPKQAAEIQEEEQFEAYDVNKLQDVIIPETVPAEEPPLETSEEVEVQATNPEDCDEIEQLIRSLEEIEAKTNLLKKRNKSAKSRRVMITDLDVSKHEDILKSPVRVIKGKDGTIDVKTDNTTNTINANDAKPETDCKKSNSERINGAETKCAEDKRFNTITKELPSEVATENGAEAKRNAKQSKEDSKPKPSDDKPNKNAAEKTTEEPQNCKHGEVSSKISTNEPTSIKQTPKKSLEKCTNGDIAISTNESTKKTANTKSTRETGINPNELKKSVSNTSLDNTKKSASNTSLDKLKKNASNKKETGEETLAKKNENNKSKSNGNMKKSSSNVSLKEDCATKKSSSAVSLKEDCTTKKNASLKDDCAMKKSSSNASIKEDCTMKKNSSNVSLKEEFIMKKNVSLKDDCATKKSSSNVSLKEDYTIMKNVSLKEDCANPANASLKIDCPMKKNISLKEDCAMKKSPSNVSLKEDCTTKKSSPKEEKNGTSKVKALNNGRVEAVKSNKLTSSEAVKLNGVQNGGDDHINGKTSSCQDKQAKNDEKPVQNSTNGSENKPMKNTVNGSEDKPVKNCTNGAKEPVNNSTNGNDDKPVKICTNGARNIKPAKNVANGNEDKPVKICTNGAKYVKPAKIASNVTNDKPVKNGANEDKPVKISTNDNEAKTVKNGTNGANEDKQVKNTTNGNVDKLVKNCTNGVKDVKPAKIASNVTNDKPVKNGANEENPVKISTNGNEAKTVKNGTNGANEEKPVKITTNGNEAKPVKNCTNGARDNKPVKNTTNVTNDKPVKNGTNSANEEKPVKITTNGNEAKTAKNATNGATEEKPVKITTNGKEDKPVKNYTNGAKDIKTVKNTTNGNEDKPLKNCTNGLKEVKPAKNAANVTNDKPVANEEKSVKNGANENKPAKNGKNVFNEETPKKNTTTNGVTKSKSSNGFTKNEKLPTREENKKPTTIEVQTNGDKCKEMNGVNGQNEVKNAEQLYTQILSSEENKKHAKSRPLEEIFNNLKKKGLEDTLKPKKAVEDGVIFEENGRKYYASDFAAKEEEENGFISVSRQRKQKNAKKGEERMQQQQKKSNGFEKDEEINAVKECSVEANLAVKEELEVLKTNEEMLDGSAEDCVDNVDVNEAEATESVYKITFENNVRQLQKQLSSESESPEKKRTAKKKKKSAKAKPAKNFDQTYDFLLNSTFQESEKTNVEISEELSKIIQRGMYSSLEEKIKSLNITAANDGFFKTINIFEPAEKKTDLTNVANTSSIFRKPKRSVEDLDLDLSKMNLPNVSGSFLDLSNVQKDPGIREGDSAKETLYPITQAVKDWMTKTRETTPEVEILKSPSILKQLKKEDLEGEEDVVFCKDWSLTPESSFEEDSLEWDDELEVKPTKEINVDVAEDVLEVYESKYGKNGDYEKIKEEIKGKAFPKHQNLPYRAICCSLM